MKILVTGGAGFIGSNIVDAYIKSGHTVVVVDNLSTGKKSFINKKAAFYKADIRDANELVKIFETEKPEVLNHHAAQISVRNSVENPNNDAEINILGLLNLLQAGIKNNLKKVIFASSGGVVYGEASRLPTPENYTPLIPLSPYGITKLSSEYYLHFYYMSCNIPYIALRYSNVYGPRQNPHGEAGVVAIFSKKLLNEETSIINGDGLQMRDYIYVGDVVSANIKALSYSSYGCFNIGTGRETSVVEIFEMLRKLNGKDIFAKHGPAKKGEQKRSCLETKLAEKLLGWKTITSLKTGLDKTLDYFRNEEKT